MSFLIGPSIGGIMYKVHPMMPALSASGLFFINIIILYTLGSAHVGEAKIIENEDRRMTVMEKIADGPSREANADTSKRDDVDNLPSRDNYSDDSNTDQSDKHIPVDSAPISTTATDTVVFSSMTIFIAALRLLISFIQSSLTSRYILNYYEDRFDMETYQLGFISSLMTGFSIVAESFIVGPALSIFRNNDYQTIIICLFILSILYTIESTCASLWTFILLALLPGSVVSTILSAACRSLFLQLIPSSHIGKVSGLFNAASTGIGVVAPIYGSQIFSLVIGDIIKLSPDSQHDPNRRYTRGIALRQKGIITAVHYLVLFIICTTHYILSQGSFLALKEHLVTKDSIQDDDEVTSSSSSSGKKIIRDRSVDHLSSENSIDGILHDIDATAANASTSIDFSTSSKAVKRRTSSMK